MIDYDNHFVDLTVDYFSRDGGFWFASLQVGAGVYNAPSSTKSNAALQAWSGYTDQQANLAEVFALTRAAYPNAVLPAWRSRIV